LYTYDAIYGNVVTYAIYFEFLLYCEGLIVSVHTGYTRRGCTVDLDYTVAVSFQPVSSLLLEQHFQLMMECTLVSWKLVAMTCLCGHGDRVCQSVNECNYEPASKQRDATSTTRSNQPALFRATHILSKKMTTRSCDEIFCYINTLSMHSYKRGGVKLGAFK